LDCRIPLKVCLYLYPYSFAELYRSVAALTSHDGLSSRTESEAR
jgi:hypothetical protein